MDKEEEKEVGHCSTGKLSVSPAPRPKAPKVLPPTISCPLPILLPMHCPSRMFTKKHEAGHFQFSPVYEIGQLQNWKVAKWREGQVCPATGLPPSITGQFCTFATRADSLALDPLFAATSWQMAAIGRKRYWPLFQSSGFEATVAVWQKSLWWW